MTLNYPLKLSIYSPSDLTKENKQKEKVNTIKWTKTKTTRTSCNIRLKLPPISHGERNKQEQISKNAHKKGREKKRDEGEEKRQTKKNKRSKYKKKEVEGETNED